MELTPKGKFSVKLEFEDDSFELTDAQLLPNGTFSCTSKKASEANPFKMIFLSPENELLEFGCEVKEIKGNFVTGLLSRLGN